MREVEGLLSLAGVSLVEMTTGGMCGLMGPDHEAKAKGIVGATSLLLAHQSPVVNRPAQQQCGTVCCLVQGLVTDSLRPGFSPLNTLIWPAKL